MKLNEYQDEAVKTAVYPPDAAVVYPLLGLANEAGEVLGKWKKYMRGDYGEGDDARKRAEYEVAKEAADCMWYLAALARDLGIALEDMAKNNLAKLGDRQERGVIKGSGDDR